MITSNKNLLIHIDLEKTFFNSGSSMEGVVFVEVKKAFDFDALYLRV